MINQLWSRWLRQAKTLSQKHWMPLWFGIVATVVVVGLWQQLWVYEHLHVEQLMRQELGAIRAEFYQELNTRVQTLQRVATRWQASDNGTPQDIWEADAAALVKDFDDYQAFAWVDPSFQVHRIVPAAQQSILHGLDFSSQSPQRAVLQQANATREPILLRQPRQKLLALVPLVTGDRIDGAIVGVLQTPALFDNLFRVPQGYQIRLYDGDMLIYGEPLQAHSHFEVTTRIRAYGLNWTLEVTPLPDLVAASRSPLPGVILVGGLAIVWILAFTIALVQQARWQAHHVKQINRQLQAEIIHRQQVEAQLRISNQAMESAVLGISKIDRQGRYHYTNTAYATLTGYRPQEMIGVHWEQTVHPDERSTLRWAYQQMVQEGRVEIETRGIRQDGSEFYKQVVMIAAYDNQHQVQEHFCFMKDITERKQAEAALKKSEENYRHLVDHLNAGFVVHALDTQILQCNETACRLLGLSMDQMLGKAAIDPAWHFVREDGTAMPIEEYPVNRVLSAQAPLNNYVVGVCQGNLVKFWVLVSAFPEFDAHYQLTHVVATFIDISQLKQAEVALSRSEERLSLVLKGSDEGWWDWDLTQNDLYYSPRWWGILGYEPEAFESTSELWQQLTHPDDIDRVTRFFYQQLNSDVESYEVEFRLRHKQGHYVSVSSRGYISRDENGLPVRVSGTNTDLSDRKAAELALKQSESIFRSFFNSDAMLMGIVEVRGNDILHISDNQVSASFFGTTPDAMKNRFASEMGISQAYLNQWLEHYREAARTQAPVKFEYLHQTSTGQRWLAASVSQISDSSSDHPRFSYIVEDITDRKHAELALEKELLQSKTLFNTSIDGIVVLNRQGDVIQTSVSFAQMIGYTLEETLQLNVADWDAQWTSEELLFRLTKADIPPIFETQHRRKDGSHYDAEISYSRVNLEGELIHFCICRNISDRKRIEAEREQALSALQQSEATKQAIIQAIPDLLIRMDSKGRYIEFISTREFNIVKPEQRRHNATICEVLPHDLAQLRLKHTQQALKEGTTQIYEQEILIKGNKRYEEVRIVPVLQDEVLVMVRDITDRKQAEIALQESEEKFRILITHAPVGIFQTDAQGNCLYVNPCWLEMTGRPVEDVLGDGWKESLHPADREAIFQEWTDAAETDRPFNLEYRFQQPNGAVIWVAGQAIAVRDETGAVVQYFGTVTDITALKHAEATKQALIESIPDFLVRLRQDGVNLEVLNHGAVRHVLPDGEVLIGQSILTTMPLGLAQERLALVQKALATGIPQTQEYDFEMNGGVIYEEARIAPLGTDEVLIMVRDITDRKQAEIALKLSQERLELALEASGDGLWDWNTETNVVYHSTRYQEILGYAPDELVLTFEDWTQTIHPDDRERVLGSLNAIFMNRSLKYSLDFRVRCKSGEWKWITDYGKVVTRDLQGNPLRMIGGSKDISDRKQAEAELKHQKNVLQTIVNHIPIMIAMFDSAGQIEFVNPEFERVLGWSLEEWQQRDVLLECYPDPAYYQMVLEHMLAASGQWKDFTTMTKAGQPIETSWTNINLSNGANLGIGQDISERAQRDAERKQKEVALQQAMEAAEAANLAKSIFLANMSHELRTPLNVILGFAQVMAHDQSLTPTQQYDLLTIRRSGDHLLSLINEVLDLSKIEAGYCELEETEFDLIALLETLHIMMNERATAKKLQLEFDIAKNTPRFVTADAQKLRQILLNLLSNAIKFTRQGSVTLRVSIHACDSSDQSNSCFSPRAIPLQFEVIDTGAGIAVEEQDAIFDAFVQADAGKKSISGTGLGLTISRKLLELMGGKITVQSTPERGSTFTVILPVSLGRGVGVSEPSEHLVIRLAPGQTNRRILVVDDEQENRLVLVRLLTQVGLEVREATNGQNAIDIWQEWHPDLIWMDLRMPDLDGYEATQHIRRLEKVRETPDGRKNAGNDELLSACVSSASIIIALTAQVSQADRTRAFAAGCNDYISKPFREETLFLKLKEYLGLEFCYANPAQPATALAERGEGTESLATVLTPALFAQLPQNWLDELENEAICGNNRAIAALAAQLPPELALLSRKLTECADQFQFEQILQVVQRHIPPAIS